VLAYDVRLGTVNALLDWNIR
jgi:hypothetical protein